MPTPLILDPAVANVFITEELRKRAPKKVDFYREKLALQDLAGRMASHPEEVLPRFVELALEMADAFTGGLSLYEEHPAPGVFRWHHLRGTMARFNGGTTPRLFSPCGITLDQNGPVLSTHPERVYTWLSDAGCVLPELLLVPLYIGGNSPLGTLWIVADTAGHFDMGHARALTDLASFVDVALTMMRSKQQLQAALDEQKMLASEMDHRVKNLFAMTEGLVRISAKGADTTEAMTKTLLGRLKALSQAHSLVRRNASDMPSSSPTALDLESLINAVLKPHEHAVGVTSRFTVAGPRVDFGDHATNGVALILHELATNAAKYGALKEDKGRIAVSWRLDGDRLVLQWSEQGGPKIDATPSTRGFGSTLAEVMATKQLSGTLDYDWRPSGAVVTMELPMSKLSA